METIALVVGICLVVVVAVSWALVAPRSPLRKSISARLTNFLEREKATEVYRTAYGFTTSVSDGSVVDAIEQRWGRAAPTAEPRFYVHSVITDQQIILRFGNEARPRIFAARIDFEVSDPAAGTLWFFEAEDHDLVGAADQLRSDFDRLIKDLSPGAVLRVHDEPVIVATWHPEGDETHHRRKPGQHRRTGDSA